MKIIVPSIGRAGSTLIWKLAAESSGKEALSIDSFKDFEKSSAEVIKTHDYFHGEPPYEYRAIFMYDDIRPIIGSLYGKNSHFLWWHLEHLKVKLWHRLYFRVLIKLDKFVKHSRFRNRAFKFIIQGDKLCFERNVKTWKSSKHTLFVPYQELCQHKDAVLHNISTFTGIKMKDFDLKKRESQLDGVPKEILDLIDQEYKDFDSWFAD